MDQKGLGNLLEGPDFVGIRLPFGVRARDCLLVESHIIDSQYRIGISAGPQTGYDELGRLSLDCPGAAALDLERAHFTELLTS